MWTNQNSNQKAPGSTEIQMTSRDGRTYTCLIPEPRNKKPVERVLDFYNIINQSLMRTKIRNLMEVMLLQPKKLWSSTQINLYIWYLNPQNQYNFFS